MTTTAFRVFVAAVTLVTLPLGIACSRSWIGVPRSDGDPGVPTTDAGGPVVDGAALEAQIMARWNAVADGRTSSVNFHWGAFDQFPHPTFKLGTGEAYGEFAEVLAAFFERDDNFDFLERNDLLETRLRNVLPSGQVGIDTTFEELLVYLSPETGHGDHPAETRARLRAVLERVRASLS